MSIENYELRTPEAVDLRYQISGIGSRFLAVTVDYIIISAGLALVVIGAIALGLFGGVGLTTALIAYLTLTFLLFWGYFVAFEAIWSGQTPGKRMMGIRVIKYSGYPIGLIESGIRNLVRFIDFLPAFYGLGVVVMFTSSQSRRLGDYAAGTVVVKEKPSVRLGDLTATDAPSDTTLGLAAPLGSVDPAEMEWHLERITPEDVMLAREFLARAPTLPEGPKQRLGASVAERLSSRVEASPPLDPVRFLERVLYLYEYER